jgi:hypothetical protein
VERLLDAGFIQPCGYAESVSNIISTEKKNTGKIWVCIDFCNLNKATPKDEYPIAIADMLINNASGHRCCRPKPPDGRRQATREAGGPEPLFVGPVAHTRPEVGVRWACHLTYT